MDLAFDVLDLVNENTQDRPFDTDVSGQYAVFAKEEAAMMLQGNWSIPPGQRIKSGHADGNFPAADL